MFWICAAVLAALALALLLRPLLRPADGAIALQAALLRDQLEALKAGHAAGLIQEADFLARKQKLSDAALALVDKPVAAPRPRSALVSALILLVALPVVMVLLYRQVGTPNALGFVGRGTEPTAESSADPAAATANAPELAAAAETLAAKLRANPEDGEGWALLGRTYRAIDQFAPARAAFEEALKRLPESADLLAESAEALGLASEPRSLVGEPEKRLDRALALDPENQRALWLKGFARKQAGDAAGAETLWQHVLSQVDPANPVNAELVGQINEVRAAQGKPALDTPAPVAAAETPTAPAAPETSAAPPATGAGITVRVDLAPALAPKLTPGAVLFVYARAESGPPMPLAIQRLPATGFPLEVKLDASMGMLPSMSLAQFERVVVGARISFSGNAQAQTGDLETLSAGMEWRKAGTVELVIDKVH